MCANSASPLHLVTSHGKAHKNKSFQTLRPVRFSVISLVNWNARRETKNTVFVSRLFALFIFVDFSSYQNALFIVHPGFGFSCRGMLRARVALAKTRR